MFKSMLSHVINHGFDPANEFYWEFLFTVNCSDSDNYNNRELSKCYKMIYINFLK